MANKSDRTTLPRSAVMRIVKDNVDPKLANISTEVGDIFNSSVDNFLRDIVKRAQENVELNGKRKSIIIDDVLVALEKAGASEICQDLKEFNSANELSKGSKKKTKRRKLTANEQQELADEQDAILDKAKKAALG